MPRKRSTCRNCADKAKALYRCALAAYTKSEMMLRKILSKLVNSYPRMQLLQPNSPRSDSRRRRRDRKKRRLTRNCSAKLFFRIEHTIQEEIYVYQPHMYVKLKSSNPYPSQPSQVIIIFFTTHIQWRIFEYPLTNKIQQKLRFAMGRYRKC